MPDEAVFWSPFLFLFWRSKKEKNDLAKKLSGNITLNIYFNSTTRLFTTKLVRTPATVTILFVIQHPVHLPNDNRC